MPQDNFLQRKQDILSKQDKSSKQSWDEKIKDLCEKINQKENYYTTSSCSGRVVVMLDKEKKGPCLFKFVSHDLLDFNKFMKDLNKIASFHSVVNNKQLMKNPRDNNNNNLIEKSGEGGYLHNITSKTMMQAREDSRTIKSRTKQDGLIKFKQEPCILHVSCRTLKDAQNLLNKAKLAGWKRSGIISSEKRFIVELNGTEKLEFPLMLKGKILVNEIFLKIVLEKANENLKKSWEKIQKFEKSL